MLRYIGVFLLALAAGCSGGYMYQNTEPLDMKDLHYPFPSKTVEVRGIHLSYIDQGSGSRTLLLVHGLASNGGFWRYNIPALAKTCRVIAVDLPGYGQSDKGPYPYTMTFFADVLSDMINTLGLGRITYVGHSMGGQIGIHFALRHPSQLDRLVLASPAGVESFTRGEGDWMKSVMTVEFVKKTPEDRIRANLAANFYSYQDSLEWMVEERARMAKSTEFEDFCYAVVRSVHGMLNEPTTRMLPLLNVPTLIIFGEGDGLIPNPILHGGFPADIADRAHASIRGSSMVMIPAAGHLSMIEKPAQFDAAVLSWLPQQDTL
jgi:pimeloyl-ACP methyl ester carboxylesterase